MGVDRLGSDVELPGDLFVDGIDEGRNPRESTLPVQHPRLDEQEAEPLPFQALR